jgi:hypothetical protein
MSIGNLSSLTRLSFSVNQLTGSIPSSFRKLSSLSLLLLYNNELTGEIPSSFADLSSLKDLRLENNLLSGEIPSGFSGFNSCSLLPGNSELCRAESFTACGGTDYTDIQSKTYFLMMLIVCPMTSSTTVQDAVSIETAGVAIATDCVVMNTWLPEMFNATGTDCCSHNLITCDEEDRITKL